MDTPKEKNLARPEQSSNEQSITQIESDYDIDSFLEKRAEFITKVKAIMVEGKDYHVIQGKKSLAKGGAEKIGSIFGWTAVFEKDISVSESFREVPGLIAFVCKLSKSGMVIGEGRGAALLGKNAGDPNKTIKMAQKSAYIDATLRASGLSDFFTQDLEDMQMSNTSTRPQTPPTTQNFTPSEPMGQSEDLINNVDMTASQTNLLNTTYDKYLENVKNSKTLQELKGYWENVKYLGKTVTASQKALLRSAIRQRQEEITK